MADDGVFPAAILDSNFVLDMKREDPGRSQPLILPELELAGRIRVGQALTLSDFDVLLARCGQTQQAKLNSKFLFRNSHSI